MKRLIKWFNLDWLTDLFRPEVDIPVRSALLDELARVPGIYKDGVNHPVQFDAEALETKTLLEYFYGEPTGEPLGRSAIGPNMVHAMDAHIHNRDLMSIQGTVTGRIYTEEPGETLKTPEQFRSEWAYREYLRKTGLNPDPDPAPEQYDIEGNMTHEYNMWAGRQYGGKTDDPLDLAQQAYTRLEADMVDVMNSLVRTRNEAAEQYRKVTAAGHRYDALESILEVMTKDRDNYKLRANNLMLESDKAHVAHVKMKELRKTDFSFRMKYKSLLKKVLLDSEIGVIPKSLIERIREELK